MKYPVLSIAAAVVLCAASSASADEEFRCQGHIISDGDQRVSVEEHCGRPDSMEENKWIYDRDKSRGIIIVHFDQDTVSLIEEVPRD